MLMLGLDDVGLKGGKSDVVGRISILSNLGTYWGHDNTLCIGLSQHRHLGCCCVHMRAM